MSDHLHVAQIRFENGKTATVTIRERSLQGLPPVLNVEGLNYVVKTSLESTTIRPSSSDKRTAR